MFVATSLSSPTFIADCTWTFIHLQDKNLNYRTGFEPAFAPWYGGRPKPLDDCTYLTCFRHRFPLNRPLITLPDDPPLPNGIYGRFRKFSGEYRIRTYGPLRTNGFQDRRFKPLSQLSEYKSQASLDSRAFSLTIFNEKKKSLYYLLYGFHACCWRKLYRFMCSPNTVSKLSNNA